MEACSQFITPVELAKDIAEVSGKKVDTVHLSESDFFTDEHKKKITEELWINLRLFHKRCGDLLDCLAMPGPSCKVRQMTMHHREMKRDVAASKAVVPNQWDSKAWLRNSPEMKNIVGY